MKARRLLNLAILAALPLDHGAVHAAGQPIEEIVVTGELRESRLLDSAASITVLSLAEQRAGTVQHLEEVLDWVPNVNFASGGARARFVQIRGIGERGQFAEPLNPSVGLLVDGVDLTGLGVSATLFDVDQVEVLRGPQGTLYGANGLAGLINVRTGDPTPTFSARLRLDAADYDARGIGGVISGPVSGNLGYRLAAQRYQDDGFMDNVFLGRDDSNAHDELTLRGKVAWTPGDSQTWTFTAGLVDADNGYDAFSLDNDRNTYSDQPGMDQQKTRYGSVAVNWDVADAASFVGTLGVARSDTDYGYDEDWSYVGFDPAGYSSTDRYLRDRETASLDLRLVSGPAGRLLDDRLEWVVGVYGLDQTSDLTRQYTFASGEFSSSLDVRRLALYGELEYSFSERTRLTFGLRGERHDAGYRNSDAVSFDPVDHMLGGRLVLERDFGDVAMGYLSATRGYKVGGFNITGTLPAALREYDPESLWSYEAGLKGRWLDGRLNARGAVFVMRRDDVQVATSLTVDQGGGAVEFIDLVSNAAEGRNRGAELEVDFSPADALTLFANVGLLDTEFVDFVNINGEDLDGEPQAHAPGYQFFVGAEYRFAPGWFLRLEAEGKDGFFVNDSNREVADRDDVRTASYELWNASLGYQAERWNVKFWGRNLGDEDYAVRGFYFGNDPRTGYADAGWRQLGEPRRFGVTLTVSN
ncbi:MAG: TonB-dependent receptor [Pseudomonadales bacterium]